MAFLSVCAAQRGIRRTVSPPEGVRRISNLCFNGIAANVSYAGITDKCGCKDACPCLPPMLCYGLPNSRVRCLPSKGGQLRGELDNGMWIMAKVTTRRPVAGFVTPPIHEQPSNSTC